MDIKNFNSNKSNNYISDFIFIRSIISTIKIPIQIYYEQTTDGEKQLAIFGQKRFN